MLRMGSIPQSRVELQRCHCARVRLCARRCVCKGKKVKKISTVRAVRHSTSEGELPSGRRSYAVWLSWDSAGRGQQIACVCLVGL